MPAPHMSGAELRAFLAAAHRSPLGIQSQATMMVCQCANLVMCELSPLHRRTFSLVALVVAASLPAWQRSWVT